MNHLPAPPRPAIGALLAAVVTLLAACSEQPTSAGFFEPASAKGGGTTSTTGPTVSSVDPAYGEQGENNKKVRVLGSGFDAGSTVEFAIDGVQDSTKVRTDSTKYVSSGELHAYVTIASDATLDLYDVVVITYVGSKKGIGTEMFEVTTAESIGTLGGNTNSNGLNDAGQVVGYSVYNTVQHAFFWERTTGMQSLGPGIAYDIAGDATVVGDSGNKAVIWTRAYGIWSSPQELQSSGLGGAAKGVMSDSVGRAILIVGGNEEKVGKSTIRYAAVWKKVDGSWKLQQRLSTPDGYSSGTNAVNRQGHIVGMIRRLSGSTFLQASLWEPSADGTYRRTTLEPLSGASRNTAMGINSQGDIVVGMSDALPVYWLKTNTGWGPAQRLAIGTGSCGGADQWAGDISDEGWIVGRTCHGDGSRATLWRGPGATREDLGALGYGKNNSSATAINNAASPIIAGHSPGAKVREGVIWQFPPVNP